MTKETSYASVSVEFEYRNNVNYVEEILARDLPKFGELNEQILEGPEELGISELGPHRYTVTVLARCSEKDVSSVTRYLNWALLQIMLSNGIKGSIRNDEMVAVRGRDE